ncbi:MAG: dTDP-4-dehydrorhamnose reductase [Caldithrix sp.]|nr:dTDP-4-dehydrorhamnose reductase [Caldithrix sp.]
MTKVLIFGSNGLLGQNLNRKFVGEFSVFGASNEDRNFIKNANISYQKVDVANRAQVKFIIEDIEPQIIINAAAYTNVDDAEKEREACWNVNVRGVENIIESAAEFKPIFVQISTDYVFDGNEPPYRETDEPNPQGNYAQSKLAAEKVVQSGSLEYLIVRTQILFGHGNKIRPNFVTWLIDELQNGKKARIVNDQIGTPSYAPDVAEAILQLLQAEAYGLFHVSNPDSLSRHEFAMKIADIFQLDMQLIEEITTQQLKQKSPRPMNSSFVIDKLVNYTNWEPNTIDKCLQLMKKELR